MSNEIIQKEQDLPIPGIGIAGKLICPILSIAGRDVECKKDGCAWWVQLHYGDKWVGHCAVHYNSILTVELRQEIEKLRNALHAKSPTEKT